MPKEKIARLEEENRQKDKKIEELYKLINEQSEVIENLKYTLSERLEQDRNRVQTGRKERFTSAEKELIKMYKVQGKSIRAIAGELNCSIGLIHKIINESL